MIQKGTSPSGSSRPQAPTAGFPDRDLSQSIELFRLPQLPAYVDPSSQVLVKIARDCRSNSLQPDVREDFSDFMELIFVDPISHVRWSEL
jgi:hypothetical protein